MKLDKLLKGITVHSIQGDDSCEVSDITYDSRNVNPGCMFVAIKGTASNGHAYISDALQQGASVIVCEHVPVRTQNDLHTFVTVENSRAALGKLASNFYGNPSENLTVIGVTGTNGKSTVATTLYHLFENLGHKAGLFSTLGNWVHKDFFETTSTTDDSLTLHRMMRDMVDTGVTHVAMEVSSHALDQDRTSGIVFNGAIFTNLTHDHIDYHGSFDAYLKAKKKLFDMLPVGAFAIANSDDPVGPIMLQDTKAEKKFYGLLDKPGNQSGYDDDRTPVKNDFFTKIISNDFEGLEIEVNDTFIDSRFIGTFNAYNLTAVFAAAILLGEETQSIVAAIEAIKPVTGRFSHVEVNGRVGIIDYAHTPDALENILSNLRMLRAPNQRIITVVGCGGDRDKAKRPQMARIAEDLSDVIFLTSDNPRSEDPNDIINDMAQGLKHPRATTYFRTPDRRDAMYQAVQLSELGDIILVAGKGHETYQEIKGTKYDFDDMAILTELLEADVTYENILRK